MKKIYFLGLALLAGSFSFAQNDTLTTHFVGSPTLYGSQGGGFVSGNNNYGDLSKMQLFDATYGVSGAGTISSVLLWVPAKEDNGGSMDVKIWEDNAGAPGTELGSVTVSLASIDTTVSGIQLIGGMTPYNVVATFGSAINIPAGNTFWAGVVLPTTSGDTVGIASTTDGDFTDAITHTGEYWNDMSFHTFGDPGNWGLDIALAVFPAVNFTGSGAGIEENDFSMTMYPNPTNGMLNFNFENNEADIIVISDMSGKTVETVMVNSAMNVEADFSHLAGGTYMIEVKDASGVSLIRSKFIKK